MVSILVSSFDGDERLAACTQTIESVTAQEHEVIKVDTRGRRGRELTLPEAFNRGASSATGEYLAFLTADTVVGPGWLERLLACAQETEAGAVGPLCNMAAGLQNATSVEGTHDPSKWRPSVRIAIAPMLVRRDTFLDLGGFDERFGSGGFADDDFCLRLAHSGRRVYIAGDVYVHRLGPRHPMQGEPERIKVLDGEARRMCTKWGLDDPMAAHPRRDVLGLVDVSGKKVLDVRARTGATILECVTRGAAWATGIEEDRRLRAVASAYCTDVDGCNGPERAGLRISKNLKEAAAHQPYDVVVAVWHLECLTHPVNYLKRLKPVMAKGAVLAACVRNAWALSRLLPLLMTAPPPTYPRPAWGPCAAPDDVLRWFEEAGYDLLSIKTAYAPPLGKEPFLDSFLNLCKNHGFMDDPKPEFYSDECWFTVKPTNS